MNVGDTIGDFVLVEIDPTKNRRLCPVYTFAHSTGRQYEFHGRIPTGEELMEAHLEWAPNDMLRARLAEYAELERMFLPNSDGNSLLPMCKAVVDDVDNPNWKN